VRSENAPRKRATLDAISAINFLANTLKLFQWLWAKRLFYGLFRIGERLVLKSGFKMKRLAIFVLNAAIRFSGAL